MPVILPKWLLALPPFALKSVPLWTINYMVIYKNRLDPEGLRLSSFPPILSHINNCWNPGKTCPGLLSWIKRPSTALPISSCGRERGVAHTSYAPGPCWCPCPYPEPSLLWAWGSFQVSRQGHTKLCICPPIKLKPWCLGGTAPPPWKRRGSQDNS